MAENICPSTDYDKLLIATDGSDYNEGAVREAISLARSCNSYLYAISVIKANTEYMALAPEQLEEAEKEAWKSLEAIKARAAESGVECEIISHIGEEIYRHIVDEAGKRGAAMIIMGRRGIDGLRKLVMGSVTARVIGHASCKVLVVPRAAHFNCRNILVATDGSADSEAAAVEAINLAKRCQGDVTAVSVYSSEADKQVAEANVQKVEELASEMGLEVVTLTAAGPPAATVTETAGRINADLIVVGSHGRTGLKRLLMGSVTEWIIGHAECSVLVARQGV